MIRCMGCMEEFDESLDTCPYCGYKRGTPPREAYHLSPETILSGRYIIGRVLGFGGFGVTYLAWDCVLEHKVAIKEYLPSDFSTRVPGETSVSIYDGELGEQFEAGLHSFVEEARRLAQFNHENGIVHIYDAFVENNTAYIVTEYLDGETLKDLLVREGKIPYQQAIAYMLPVLRALQTVHDIGIIHRDIAPDNIFLTKDGSVKLIDFGASRYATTLHSKSLSVILKPGYAPEEQYRSRGIQGPYSDVYACCATLYRAITGKVPDDALERCANDTLVPPSKLGIEIPESVENAILNGLNTKAENRIQTAAELADALSGNIEVERIKEIQIREDVGKWKKRHKILAASSAGAILLAIILAVTGVFGIANTLDTNDYAVVPDYIGMTIDEAQKEWEKYCTDKKIENISLQTAQGVTKDEATNYEVDQIYATSPQAGQWFKRVSNTAAYLYVTIVLPSINDSIAENAGKSSWTMIDLENYSLTDAQNYLNSMQGVNYDVIEIPSEKAKNVVISTVPGAGSEINAGDSVTIYVSDGSQMSTVQTYTKDEIDQKKDDSKEKQNNKNDQSSNQSNNSNSNNNSSGNTATQDTRVTVPSFKNQAASDAAQSAASLGLRVQLEFCYSDNYGENRVANQSISYGTKVQKGSEITFWISSGSADNAWSSWSTSRPNSKYETRSQTQYRYRTRSIYQQAVYGSWSSTQWSTSTRSTGDTVKYVGSRTKYRYWHYVKSNNIDTSFGSKDWWFDNRYPSIQTYHETYQYDLSYYGSGTTSGVSCYSGYTCPSCHLPFWYRDDNSAQTEYGYQTRSKSYNSQYTSWSSWSDWETKRVNSSDICDVESRTVYSYREKLPEYN